MTEPGTPATAKEEGPSEDTGQPMAPGWVISLGLYHVLLALLFFYLIIEIWPGTIPVPEDTTRTVSLFWGAFSVQFSVTPELQVVLLVILSGGLGSFVHAASSFVNFVGARSIGASWHWWYLLRPFIGMALALGFYFAVRAGFFTTSAGTATLNTVGFTATGFLVGMFTRQATEKLAEVFATLFRVRTEDKSELTPVVDKLHEEKPTSQERKG